MSALAQARALLAEAADYRRQATLADDAVRTNELICDAKQMERAAFELVRESWQLLPKD